MEKSNKQKSQFREERNHRSKPLQLSCGTVFQLSALLYYSTNESDVDNSFFVETSATSHIRIVTCTRFSHGAYDQKTKEIIIS